MITTTSSHERIIEARRPQMAGNPPPLAPLSSTTVKTIVHAKLDDADNTLKSIKSDSSESALSMSQKLSANKMLTDLLEKKSDPPCFEVPTKRKIDAVTESSEAQPNAKRIECVDLCGDDDQNTSKCQTKKAADLYAELAGSILEDEEVEETPVTTNVEQKLLVTVPKTPPQKQLISLPIQRQLVMSQTSQGQMILQPNNQGGTTSTQGVPILLQHSGQTNLQIQKPASAGGKMGQPTLIATPQTQQYILATNSQGQTYVVAQPSNPPMPQAVLLTQASQGHGAPSKTIIILQQQGGQSVGVAATSQTVTQSTPQKLIMTTSPRSQVLVAQNPRQQIAIMNPQSSGSVICGQTQNGQKIYITRDEKQGQPVIIHQKEQIQVSQSSKITYIRSKNVFIEAEWTSCFSTSISFNAATNVEHISIPSKSTSNWRHPVTIKSNYATNIIYNATESTNTSNCHSKAARKCGKSNNKVNWCYGNTNNNSSCHKFRYHTIN